METISVSVERERQLGALSAKLKTPKRFYRPLSESGQTARALSGPCLDQLGTLSRIWCVPRAALECLQDAAVSRVAYSNISPVSSASSLKDMTMCDEGAGSSKNLIDWQRFYRSVISAERPSDVSCPHTPEAKLYRVLRVIERLRKDTTVPAPPLDDIMYSCAEGIESSYRAPHGTIARTVVATVVRKALESRYSTMFSKHMTVATAAVLFFIDPEKHALRISRASLKAAQLSYALRRMELANEFVACLTPVEAGKFSALIRDLTAVVEDSGRREGTPNGYVLNPVPCRHSECERMACKYVANSEEMALYCSVVSKGAVLRYCEQRNLLTRRTVMAVFTQHGSALRESTGNRKVESHRRASAAKRMCFDRFEEPGLCLGSTLDDECSNASSDEMDTCVDASSSQRTTRKREESACPLQVMSGVDFARLYLALVHCGSNVGIRYWFSVMDADGDGVVSMADAHHFYAERKRDAERLFPGTVLCHLSCVWTRISASVGVAHSTEYITTTKDGVISTDAAWNLRQVLRMSRADREFMLCALLIRRIDESQLIDSAATELLSAKRAS